MIREDWFYHTVLLRSLLPLKGSTCLLMALMLVDSHDPGSNWFLPTSFPGAANHPFW